MSAACPWTSSPASSTCSSGPSRYCTRYGALKASAATRDQWCFCLLPQGYEGSLIKLTSKQVGAAPCPHPPGAALTNWGCGGDLALTAPRLLSPQPVGFVSFDSRSEAEAAKNALNVSAGTPWGTPKEMDPSIYYLVETSWGSPVPPHPHIKAKCC